MSENFENIHIYKFLLLKARSVKNQPYIFGILEDKTQKVYLEAMKNKETESYLKILHTRILPGTIILSDEGPAQFKAIKTLKLKHYTIKHKEEFLLKYK